jgi:hypothetical protein
MEAALDEVWGGWREPLGDRGALTAPQVAALEPVDAHQTLDALAVDRVPEAAQLGMDAPDSIGALVLGMDLTDLHEQGVVGGLPLPTGLRAGEPPVVARARDPKDPAYPLNAEGFCVGGDEVPTAGLHFISFAK